MICSRIGGISNGVNRCSSSSFSGMEKVEAVGVQGILRSMGVGIVAAVGGLWIRVGEGGGFAVNMSLHVCTAKRKGEGVTVLRGYFVGAPSRNKVSRPAEAGDGGDPAEADNRVANDFLGEATLLNFLICNGALCRNSLSPCCVCCSMSISIILTICQERYPRLSSQGINGERAHGSGIFKCSCIKCLSFCIRL